MIPQILWALLILGIPVGLPAQTSAVRPKTGAEKGPLTQITIELLTGNEGVGISAQRWSQIFQELNVTLSIRRGRSDDKLGTTEKKIGDSVRQVRVVGRLDKGRLVLEDRAFAESDTEKLAAWLKELRTYGAQGSPDGQPMWGLTKQQFGIVHSALSQTLVSEPREQTVQKALTLFALPDEHPVRFTSQATARLQQRGQMAVVRQSLKGLSKGTALAVLMNEQGLGFRPRRLPGGVVELSIFPLSETDDVWPVGWPLKQTGPATAPKLFAYTPVNLEEIELDAVLEAAADVVGVPILIDRHGLESRKIDLSKIKVSHSSKRTNWSLALKAITFQARAKPELLIDEAGKPFVWITPIGTPRAVKE